MNVYKCDPCGKVFTGMTPYEAHIVSEKHISKITQSESVGNLNKYFCTICRISTSGPVPFKSHLESVKHKKKAHLSPVDMEVSIEDHDVVDTPLSPLTISMGKQYWCSDCKIMLNSVGQWKMHIAGVKHMKQKQFKCDDKPVNEYHTRKWNESDDYALSIFESDSMLMKHVMDNVTVIKVNEPIIL